MNDTAAAIYASFLNPDSFRSVEPYQQWVQEQYLLLSPTVLSEALRCAETGEDLQPTLIDTIQRSAREAANIDIPLSVIARGSLPALRSIANVFASGIGGPVQRGETALLVGRASLIACELTAHWWEAWAQTRFSESRNQAPSLIDGQSLDVIAIGTSSDLSESSLEMLALAAKGASTEDIAKATSYSTQAVKWHFARAMKAWKVTNRTALVSVAFMRGVLVRRRHGRIGPIEPPPNPPALSIEN